MKEAESRYLEAHQRSQACSPSSWSYSWGFESQRVSICSIIWFFNHIMVIDGGVVDHSFCFSQTLEEYVHHKD